LVLVELKHLNNLLVKLGQVEIYLLFTSRHFHESFYVSMNRHLFFFMILAKAILNYPLQGLRKVRDTSFFIAFYLNLVMIGATGQPFIEKMHV
jgi:hypothetical protein